MLVPMGWMRRASWSKCRLVHLKVIAGMSHTVQDRPGFVLTILLYRQLAIGLDEGSERRAVRLPTPMRPPAWRSPAEENGGLRP